MSRFFSPGGCWIIYFCLVFSFLSGCDKIPKPADFQKNDPKPEVVDNSEPVAPPEQMELPLPIESKSPAEIIAEFRAKKSMEIDDKALEKITQLADAQAAFETLDLSNSRVTDKGLATVSQLTNLRELNLTNSQVRGQSLSALKELNHLEVLVLDSTPFDSLSGEVIKEFGSLRELSLKSTGVSDNFYQHLAELAQLEVLHLDGNKNLIGRHFADLVAKEKFPELKTLTASGTKFGHYGLLSADRLKKLEVLQIQDSGLNLKSIIPISKCNNLKVLNLSANPLSNESLAPFKRLKKLEDFNLSHCTGISDPAVKTLKTMRHLKTLNLTGTSMTPKATETLRKSLKDTEVIF